MIIESQVIQAGISADSLFDSLKDPARLEEFLPSNQVSDFTASESGCSFKVTGGFAIGIERTEEEKPALIRFESQKGTPIRFILDVLIQSLSNETSSMQVRCDADLNPFMKMMAEKPLQAIFSGMADAVVQKYPLK